MAVEHPDIHNPRVDEPSPPRSVHDSEDESIAGSEPASPEGPQLWDVKDLSSQSYQYEPKSLVEAVRQCNHLEFAAILENERVEVDEKGPDGRTALSVAIQEGKYEHVGLLLKKRADPNTREDQNRTPFFWAAMRRRQSPPDSGQSNFGQPDFRYKDMIETLLGFGADPSLTDDRGDTPLAVAAAKGDEAFVKEILSIGPKTDINLNLENKNTDGHTALCLAAGEGHDGIVKLLIESGGAEINPQGNEETSPLMCAAAAGSPKCMRYLLSHGANMGSCSWWERFQTRSRQRKENAELSRHQKPDSSQWQKLFQRQQSDLKELISWLHNRSLEDEKPPEKRPFLWLAVEYEDEEIVELLLDLGADPNTRDTTEHQMTPLIRALKIGNMDIVGLLKKKDRCSMHILVDEADDMGEKQALEFARKLLGQGYDLNKRNPKGQNPVHIACHKGRKQFVEEFLHPKYGEASIHYADNSGKTPLQYAMDKEDIVKLLLENGAEISDVSTAILFKLRNPEPRCVQLTRYQKKKTRLHLISDPNEARELWNLQSGENQLRLFNRGLKIPEFRTPELEEDRAVRGKHWRFFQPKCPSQSGETQLFKLSISFPGWKNFPEPFPLEIAWAIKEMDNKLAYGYISTVSTSTVPEHHAELLEDLMTEVAAEWRQRVSGLVNEIDNIRRNQVDLQGRSRTVLERLQDSSKRQAMLQDGFEGHITGLRHVVDIDPYLRKEPPGDQKGPLREIIREMDQEVSPRLARVEQSIRELLQIEIAWITIRESKSIKRLTWITFIFLPLMFASSLFGMNVNLLKENPDWRWFLPIAASLILLTLGLWLLSHWAEQKLEPRMKGMITRENHQDTTPDDGRKSFESILV